MRCDDVTGLIRSQQPGTVYPAHSSIGEGHLQMGVQVPGRRLNRLARVQSPFSSSSLPVQPRNLTMSSVLTTEDSAMKQNRQVVNQQTRKTAIMGLVSLSLCLGTLSVHADHSERTLKTGPLSPGPHFGRANGVWGKVQHDRHDRKARPFKRKGDFARHGWQGHRFELDLPIHFRGTDRLRLRKIAQRHFAIDLDRYRLIRVVVDGHGHRHRPGTAGLIVGQHRSQETYLNGRVAFRAPDARRKANWQLQVRNAQIRHVRLILEPRFYAYAHRSDYRTHRSTRWRKIDRRHW